VFAGFQDAASFPFNEYDPVMLDAVAGVPQASTNSHGVANGKWIKQLLKNIVRANFDIVIQK
jgi:hypothetical protein